LTAIYEKSTGTKMNDLDGMSTNCNLRYYAYFAERNFAENVTTTARVCRMKQQWSMTEKYVLWRIWFWMYTGWAKLS